MANVNLETGIPYGIIDARNVPYLLEDIVEQGMSEWDSFRKEQISKLQELVNKWKEFGAILNGTEAECVFDETHWDRDNMYNEETEYSYTDKEGNEFLLSHLGGAPLIWCIKTDTIVQARKCSPCIPGGGDLDSLDEYGFDCYGVPKQYIEEVESI